ncbi:MAG TPA: rRNA maturation RNase YbeY [Anaerolineae bacterium]|nr:rRNA maturation RNase YbeY [Anaerolineae bacterium]HCK66455.1 rRNA maturation RNase YbeY [Anaerolineae bacterium]
MIHIDNQQDFLDSPLLERAAQYTLDMIPALHADLPPALSSANITIVLTDDRQLHELNHDFLDVDSPTDVLSFPSLETDPETNELYLGDILISIPRAKQQAESAGHTLEAEVQLLVVHGTLHLLGYDHASDEEKSLMWNEQAKVLERLGLSRIKIQE